MSDTLNLSDEEFLNSSLPTSEAPVEKPEEVVPEAEEEVLEDKEEVDEPTEKETPDSEETTDEGESAPADSSPEDGVDEESVKDEEDKKEEAPSSSVDYKAEYEKLMKPFKANGRDIKVDSVEEAIQLMQMGANYTKKMAALKPGLKVLRMLEDHGLMDENKLSFLIDIEKKNPKAISKLVKDSGIDPLDLDTDSGEYKPSSYTVDDKEMELDAVLEKISSTSAYTRTIDVVSNKWDASSKALLLNNPTIIEVINEHIATGIYDQIASVMDKERMLGRLTGLSDLEAYKHVGDMLQAQGKFGVANQTPVAKTVVKPAVKASEDPTLVARKKAAGLTQNKASQSKAPADFNPLALSDTEFEKFLANKKFV